MTEKRRPGAPKGSGQKSPEGTAKSATFRLSPETLRYLDVLLEHYPNKTAAIEAAVKREIERLG